MAQKTHLMHGRDHLPRGADPIPGLLTDPGGGDTIDGLILAGNPDGFWKLDESSGTVAADSSGNSLAMTSSGFIPPLWAQPSGPPGRQTADFDTGSGTAGAGWARLLRSWAALTTDFTAGVWLKSPSAAYSPVMGQGSPSRSGGAGWQIQFIGPGGSHDRPSLLVAGVGAVYALNPLAAGTWAFAAVTYKASSGEWKLYVDGLLQNSISGGSYASATGLWLGQDGAPGLPFGVQPCHCTLSYAFLIGRTLTGSELLAMNTSTVPIDRTNMVLTINGSGQQEWLPPTIEVQY